MVGIARKEINHLVLKLQDMYKDQIDNPPKGKTYPEVYDVDAARPFSATRKIYEEMRNEIKDKFGYRFKY